MALGLAYQTVSAESPKVSEPSVLSAGKDLGQAMVVNQVLRVVLNAPAQILLFNSRGQSLYQAEAGKGQELIPLKSIDFGFLFVTLRQGKHEQSFRLLHDGK